MKKDREIFTDKATNQKKQYYKNNGMYCIINNLGGIESIYTGGNGNEYYYNINGEVKYL